MNNLQFWIWVIVVVVTLIARARGKKRPPAPVERRPQYEQEEPKQMTFEELLKEIEAAKYPERQSQRSGRPEPEPEPEVPVAKDPVKESFDLYEKAKAEAFQRPSLEETMKLSDTIVRFGQFKGYQQAAKPGLAREFAQELRNPQSFRKAFIMSEILSRRF